MIRANDPLAAAITDRYVDRLENQGWYHSIELPDGRVTPGFQTIEQLQTRLAQFPIPDDLRGKRVLDIGAWDGWFSFEMERRGAEVLAVDCIEQKRFLTAREMRGSRVEYMVADVYELTPQRVGRFDIVLFLGVLYHLKHPLLALEMACNLTRDLCCVESFVTDEGDLSARPRMEFYERDELLGRFDNWSGPNTSCLTAFCRTAGFARVDFVSVLNQRAHVVCRRKWEPACGTSFPAPVISAALNDRTGDAQADSSRDEYLSIWFKSCEPDLSVDSVFPEIGGYGVRPVYVGPTGGDGWQTNVKLPPGLAPGRHELRLWTKESPPSAAVPAYVDLAESPAAEAAQEGRELRIAIVADGHTWERNQVRLRPRAAVSLWVDGLPDDVTRQEIAIPIAGRELPAAFLSAPDAEGLRQVNVMLPDDLAPGAVTIAVVYNSRQSPSAAIEIHPPDGTVA